MASEKVLAPCSLAASRKSCAATPHVASVHVPFLSFVDIISRPALNLLAAASETALPLLSVGPPAGPFTGVSVPPQPTAHARRAEVNRVVILFIARSLTSSSPDRARSSPSRRRVCPRACPCRPRACPASRRPSPPQAAG